MKQDNILVTTTRGSQTLKEYMDNNPVNNPQKKLTDMYGGGRRRKATRRTQKQKQKRQTRSRR